MLQHPVVGAVPGGHGVRRAGGPRALRHPLAVRGRRRHVPLHRARRHGKRMAHVHKSMAHVHKYMAHVHKIVSRFHKSMAHFHKSVAY